MYIFNFKFICDVMNMVVNTWNVQHSEETTFGYILLLLKSIHTIGIGTRMPYANIHLMICVPYVVSLQHVCTSQTRFFGFLYTANMRIV